jgi:Protein of unknown function (DUF3577)
VLPFLTPARDTTPDGRGISLAGFFFFILARRNTMKNPTIRYFNAHTEAFGYLNGLKLIQPNPGQNFKPFWSSTFTMLEGNPQSPKKKYFNVTIAAEKVVELLSQFQQQLNSDIPVFANARLADVDAEPYSNNGKIGINWSAKIISLIYLKVGDTVIELKKPTTTDYGVKVDLPVGQPMVNVQRVDLHPHDGESGLVNDDQLDLVTQLFGFPFTVELRKDDPQFTQISDRLKMSGYRWNKVKNIWMKAEVSLEKSNNPHFQQMFDLLKQAGYFWSADAKVWKHTDFDQKPASRGQGSYQNAHTRYQSQARA